jgi:arabinogalactan endo-1,4-beta-galactosidase
MPNEKNADAKLKLNRREVLKASGLGLGAIAAGLTVGKPLTAISDFLNPRKVEAATFYKGCDISYQGGMESEGYSWKNSNGQTEDLLSILKGYGVNAIRLRTFVNPAQTPYAMCDVYQMADAAVAAKNAGMAILVDFMFGDGFNSVGKQNPPAAWAKMSYTEMKSTLGSYVYQVCEILKDKGVTPTWMQMGNEINSGLCHPIGEVSNGAQMTGLIMAAHSNIKLVFPNCQTIIHLAQPQNTSSIEEFFTAYIDNGGQWDVTGFSSYATGSEISGIISNMKEFQSKYGKPVMQVETGSPTDNPGDGKAYLSEYISGVGAFGGLGVFYWEPETYPPFNGDKIPASAWTSNAEPTETMQGFYTNP